jgi:hypothetical protein
MEYLLLLFVMRHLLLLSFFFFLSSPILARNYPIQTVTLNSCDPSQEQCVFDLPRIVDADYRFYRNSRLHRRIYTVLRWATYPGQWDIGQGSHKGVDISTATKTPVYSIGSGRIIKAWWDGNRGNVIVIEHDHKGGKIYSSYAHLGAMFVRIGDIVDANHLIAEVGDSGNAFGSHLHRQLDTNQNGVYPFHFFNCPGSLTEIVNTGLCRNQLIANTLDPIAFVEEQIYLREQALPLIPFSFAWFLGGYTQLETLQLFHIRQDDPTHRLSQPISVSFDTEKVSIFPQELRFIWSQRTLYMRWKKSGFTIISLMQWDRVVHRIPLIIWEKGEFHIDNDTIVSLFTQLP